MVKIHSLSYNQPGTKQAGLGSLPGQICVSIEANSTDVHQTARMRRLICVFVLRKFNLEVRIHFLFSIK